MDAVAYRPADPQATGPVQMGERPLHGPALGVRAGAVPGAAASDQRFHTEIPDQAAVLVVVVATVAQHRTRAAPRPATLTAHRRHGLDERDQPGDVVSVAAGQGGGERAATGVGDQVVSAARPAPADRALSGLG
ncbi:hypothetical protein GCM10010259_14050 [Streptomyces daghestanicus]|uniref:Uncharacterized protein n=1 Tax=Streptomyces daghestanicus TaxID=66885 RepID=A0ABQ3PXM8_9ACTN|nr:hypothetical protein GCM10010240_37710 [Streptomyces griseoviridis]GGU24782.1 hypothetical protein GCM10010259_14050 [Streptomyces daghestanicus]GHI29774.1 hypothetical protein Sdagh_15040 [Streptomyces daghestanicus]